MTELYTGNRLGKALCELLGLDASVITRIEIDCPLEDMAKVTTHGFAKTDDEKIDYFRTVIRQYKLRPIDVCQIE